MADLVSSVPELNSEESLPEENTEETEALESESEVEESSEETEITAEEPAEEAPERSRASERIQQLIADKKALQAQLNSRVEQPQIEGVDESGIDPERFAKSVVEKATRETLTAMQSQQQFQQAETNFPLVRESNLVRARAAELVDQQYTPLQAAEIASLEFQQAQETVLSKSKARQSAGTKLRTGSQIPQAGKTNPEMSFDEDTISRMSLTEYSKHREQILKENGIG